MSKIHRRCIEELNPNTFIQYFMNTYLSVVYTITCELWLCLFPPSIIQPIRTKKEKNLYPIKKKKKIENIYSVIHFIIGQNYWKYLKALQNGEKESPTNHKVKFLSDYCTPPMVMDKSLQSLVPTFNFSPRKKWCSLLGKFNNSQYPVPIFRSCG